MKKKKTYDGPLINIDPRLVIGTREAAQMLGVGEREVRCKIQRKKLPALKTGNRYYIHAHAPRVYLEYSEAPTPPVVGQPRGAPPSPCCQSDCQLCRSRPEPCPRSDA